MAKNNATENQIQAKIIKQHWRMRQHENWPKTRYQVYRYKLQG